MWLPGIYFLIGLFSIRRFRIVQSNETCQRNHERSCMCSFWVDWLKRENQNLFFFTIFIFPKTHQTNAHWSFFLARMQSLFQIYTSFGWLFPSHKHVECWIEEYIILQFIIRRNKAELKFSNVFSLVEVVIYKGIDVS